MKRIVMWCLLVTAVCATGTRAADTTATEENPKQLTDSIVVTANRFGLTPKKSVWPAAVIDLNQAGGDISFKQTLDGRDGLDIRQYNGVGSVTTLSNWGLFNRNMLLLYNGRVVKDYSLGGFNLSDFSPDEFERVELLKGPQSVLYGSDAVGGVVNLIPRTSLVDRFDLTSRVGSHNLQQYFLNASRRLGTVGVGAIAEFGLADNSRPNAGSRRTLFGLRSDYLSADGRHKVSLSGRYFRDSLGVPGPVPDPAAIPVYGNAEASSLRDHQLDENYSLDASYRYLHPRLGEAQFDLFWEKKNLDYQSLYNYQSYYYSAVSGANPPDSVLNIDSVDVTARSIYNKRSAGISGRFLHEGSTFSFSGGVDWLSGSLRATESDQSRGTNIMGPNAPFGYAFPTYSYWAKGQNQLDVWSGTTYDLPASIRLDLSGRLQFVKDRRTQPTYNVGAIYSPRSNVRLKVGYGYAFRLPTIAEQYANDLFTSGNANLSPETSRSWVGTAQWESGDQSIQASATVFRQSVGSLIQYVYDTVIYRSVPVNVNRFTSNGLDLALSLSPNSRYRLDWSGVWQRARQSASGGGGMMEAFYVPDVKWRCDATAQLTPKLSTTASLVYTSDRGIILYGNMPKRIGKVYEFGLGLSTKLLRGVSVSLTGLDLTNQKRPEQFGFTSSDRDYPSPGRRLVLELHATVL
jgi:vitamin B12 transporter